MLRSLSETTGFALRLQQREQIPFTHRTLHIADDRAVAVVKELNADLRDSTSGTSSSNDLRHLSELHGLVHLEYVAGALLVSRSTSLE